LGKGLDRQTLLQVQLKDAIGRDVTVEQRRQGAQVLPRQTLLPVGLPQHLLSQQRIDVNQAHLEQMQAEQSQLLVRASVGRDLPAATVEDETVGAVPVLNDVQALVNLPPQRFRGRALKERF